MTAPPTDDAAHLPYTPPVRLVMAPDHLDLWLVRGPEPEALAGLLAAPELSARERERAAGFRRPRDAALYAAAHLALRRVLGGYLRVAPTDVPFVREPCPGCGGPHGRPALAHDGPPLHFSLGHSHGLALFAVAATVLGVDVQRVPGAATVGYVGRMLHPDERAELTARRPPPRHVFGQLWARKEAYLKALGTGLSRGTALDYVGADPTHRPPGWTFIDIPCGPEHQAAVALRGEWPARIRTRWLGAGAARTDHESKSGE
ncbi:4'-phosphopantetheinyl transferase superfamily protein [Streptomyces sp. Je 1-79]|uniref:4'-phosphopantetheinyl transferase family protein n=1 Tax=Streptomyces sp. Je 1-79 TaxID=2943847 RepID=UPI0021A2D0E9|nr:4'-phosphopantetheinyl transferase superfamily protein [Streptomyces sp. Je 1-79]MCT4356440.1 4'-phosphopantetheinyl transferase superfamily protein [Streptomyces sp. Je 1-79]